MVQKIVSIFTIIFIILTFSGCQDDKSEDNINFSDMQSKLISKANFDNSTTDDLKDIKTAQQYGISIDDIEDGFVYSTKNENSDKIILAKTKGGSSVENIEKAIANEVSGLISSWEDNASESKKLNDHVLKTKDNYVILIISENSANLEDEFDNFFK